MSYLAIFVAICSYNVSLDLSEKDRAILTQSASRVCVKQHTRCMGRKLKGSSAWRKEEIELKALQCINEVK